MSGLLSCLTRLLSWLPGLLPRLPRLSRLLTLLACAIRSLLRGGRIQLLIERIKRTRHRLLLRR